MGQSTIAIKTLFEEQDKDAKTIGLETDEVTAAVRSRLRAESLFDADSLPYLYVRIYVASQRLSVFGSNTTNGFTILYQG